MGLENNFYEQNIGKSQLWGIDTNNTIPNNAFQQKQALGNNLVSDTVQLNGLSISKNINGRTTVSFTELKSPDVIDNIINTICQIPDPNERSIQLRNYLITLLDDENYEGALKAVNATPSLIYKNAMFKGLIQELAAAGKYNMAISLTNTYPDVRVKTDLQNYLSNYFNTYLNDSSLAAQALGDNSILTVAKLKTQSVFGSVGNFFSGIGNSVTSIFSSPTKSQNLANSALNTVGKRFRYDFLDGGNLACAYSVTQMLKGAGLQNIGSSECNTLASQLSKNGFSRVYGTNFQPIKGMINYQPGDIVFFTRNNKNGFGHVGMVAEVKNGIPYMVHNSSSKREVVKVRLDQYYKTPVAVFRAR